MTALEHVPDPVYPWLGTICDADSMRPITELPYSGVRGLGRTWTMATNGHVMVLVPDGHASTVMPEAMQQSIDDFFAREFPLPIRVTREIDFRAFKQFIGAEHEVCWRCQGERFPCDTCAERGTVPCTCECGDDHEATCDKCGGTGRAVCPECSMAYSSSPALRVRLFGGHAFNVRMLRGALRHFADATVVVSGITEGGEKPRPLMFAGADWRVIVMPLSGMDNDPALAPLAWP